MKAISLVLAGIAVSAIAQLYPTKQNLAESVAIRLSEVRLQEELGLRSDQRERVSRTVQNYSTRMSALNEKISKASDAQRTALSQQLANLEVGTAKEIVGLLDVAQSERLWQIAIQNTGPFALRSPVVARKVGLTPAQSKQINSIAARTLSELTTLGDQVGRQIDAAPPGPSGEPKRAAISKSYMEKSELIEAKGEKAVLALLSASQIQKWRTANGSPFKL
jgi:hypothetical protein